MRFFLILLLGAGLLSGCATGVMSEKECLAGDWYGAGLTDGAKGLLESAFDERAASCNEFGAPADIRAYEQGRDAALSRLCTDDGGYRYGRAGNGYLGVCRPEAEADFLSGYLTGRRIFAVQVERDAVKAAYDDAVSTLDHHRNELRRARNRLDNVNASAEQIKKAREDERYHSEEIPDAERDANDRLYELGRADEALAAVIGTSQDWRRGDAFLTARAILIEAHQFARSVTGIDYCTDDLPRFRPRCQLRYEAALKDSRSGAECARGPGEVHFARRGVRIENRRDAGFVQFYDFFPTNARGRPTRRPRAAFQVFFSPDGAYDGLACDVGPAANSAMHP